jgi:hypothetical protein
MFATRQIGKTLVNRTQGTSKFLLLSWHYKTIAMLAGVEKF